MAEAGGGFGNKYPYFYGPEGRLVLVDSALEAVNRGSTTIGIKTPSFALLASHIKPIRPLVEPMEKVFAIDAHVGAVKELPAVLCRAAGGRSRRGGLAHIHRRHVRRDNR